MNNKKTIIGIISLFTLTFYSCATTDSIFKKAKSGNAKAQYNRGVMYIEGDGVSKDDSEAFKWITKSAKQGNAKAQGYLGSLYNKGEGVSKNDFEAFK